MYFDNPEEQLVSGSVYWETGEVIANADVAVWEGRSFFTMFPISYPAAARTVISKNGNFEVFVKNSWPAGITASIECGFGSIEVSESEISDIVIKVKKHANKPSF